MFKKKIISFVLFFVFIISLCCVSVSASMVSNGASIDVSEHSYLRINGTNSFYSPLINDQGDQFVLRYQIDQALTSSIDTVTYYDFNSSHNYGTIEILTMSGFGSVFASQSWNGLYNSITGEKLNDGNVTSSGFKISYTGYIPSRFEIRCYFTSSIDDLLQVIIINSFSFTPLSDPNPPQDNGTDKIINNQNQNADKIVNNQNQNADKIINNQNQLQENEKNEASNGGANGVGDITSVIPNKSEGFINSLGNFVSLMNYNGIECNWELPSVSLPKINGVMEEIKLWDKQEIPFEYWISKIPSSIINLVQHLLTLALIVYCFKELYSVISYVLTLKGGGASE